MIAPNEIQHNENVLRFKSEREAFLIALDNNIFGLSTILTSGDYTNSEKKRLDLLYGLRALWYNFGGDWIEFFDRSTFVQKAVKNKANYIRMFNKAPEFIKNDSEKWVLKVNFTDYNEFVKSLWDSKFPPVLNKDIVNDWKNFRTKIYSCCDFFAEAIKLGLDILKYDRNNDIKWKESPNDPIIPESFEPDQKTQVFKNLGSSVWYKILGADNIVRDQGMQGNNIVWQTVNRNLKYGTENLNINIATVGTPPDELFRSYAQLPRPTVKDIDPNAGGNSKGVAIPKGGNLIEGDPIQPPSDSGDSTPLLVGAGLLFLFT